MVQSYTKADNTVVVATDSSEPLYMHGSDLVDLTIYAHL